MARRSTKKTSKKDSLVLEQTADTVTFSKQGLIAEVGKFLEEEGACDGDWENKVKERFLGMKPKTVDVEFTVKVSTSLDIASDSDKPSVQEAQAALKALLERDEYGYGTGLTVYADNESLEENATVDDITVTKVG